VVGVLIERRGLKITITLIALFMKVYLECEVRGAVERKIVDNDSGETSIKYRTFLENEDGERLELNCKKDYSSEKGKFGVAAVGVYSRDGGGFWLTLLDFTPKHID